MTFFGKESVQEMKKMQLNGESSFPVESYYEIELLVDDNMDAMIDEIKANQIATDIVQGFLAGADIDHKIPYYKLNLCMIKSENAANFRKFVTYMINSEEASIK